MNYRPQQFIRFSAFGEVAGQLNHLHTVDVDCALLLVALSNKPLSRMKLMKKTGMLLVLLCLMCL